ncbi:CD209 antigen-like protein 2 [Pomacea canaliculata]|uniref:CD209 antigen-like protein 2 n=1 Tax=Pomacea canaliculata TaxID=400727 RepID=UPI000D7371F1|nr:CD209 antigen-like protein 2 [Pomacea canaliculata]
MVRVLLLLSACVSLCVCSQCPVSWTFNANKCYAYIDLNLPWIEAIDTCKTLGGHLVEISSATENHFVSRLMHSKELVWTWLGFNDLVQEDRWVSATSNQPMVYRSWGRGEPNDNGNEDCVQISNSGVWNDISCDPGTKRTFICQRKAD